RLAVKPRLQRFREQRVSPLGGILRDEFSFILIFLLTFVPPFLPIGTALRSLSSETRAVRFLEAAWQVQGAALGLSLAVVLFVFQSAYGSRLGGRLREFAVDPHDGRGSLCHSASSRRCQHPEAPDRQAALITPVSMTSTLTLQNRCGRVTHGSVGSTPAPLRSKRETRSRS